MPDQTQLVDELRRRIAYPTVYLPRELDHAGNPAETEERWAARAVTAGLDDGTLGYVPAGQQLHRADFDHLAAERDRWKNHSTQVQFESDRLTVQLAVIRDLAKLWTSRPNTPEHDCGVDILTTLGRFDGGTATVAARDKAREVPEQVADAAARLRCDIREAIDVCYGELGGEADTPEDVAGTERAIAHDMATVLDWIARGLQPQKTATAATDRSAP